MKDFRFGTCVAGVAMSLIGSVAHAQSSVTLYGVIDEGIDYVSNSGGHSLWRMRDGTYDGVFGSRWGLRGTEDLGGGLSAIFKLENGFSLENGQLRQGGLEFGRQAYVGLSHATYGTLTMGRQYDSVVDFLQPVTAPGTFGGYFWHSGDIDNTANSFRVNNSVKYASPTFAGLQFGGMYSFTNTNAPGRGTTGMWSIGATYSLSGLTIAGAYEYAKNPAVLFADGNFVANTTGAAIGAAGPFSYVGNPANEQIFGAGATYKLGKALLGLDYTNTKFNDANGSTAIVRFENYEAFAQYNLTPVLSVGGAYTYTHGSVGYNQTVPVYHEVALTTTYSLSKRTSFYAMAAWQKAAAGATQAALFDGVVGDASTNNHQIAARIGMYTKF
ncbi:porin [Paraburkholderia aspalathi]|uniref:Outer membrane protein (Porin) n=1 Tax=Paraburkholderia aspalathi TaxID=1324617 RepID=A0A1I6YHR9_9BURK|nr:porin [Paraburkholderia aspalathi]SFT49881.1 Outer membrane protein (porin) [Paraburkholderia aspalathi]